MKRIIFFFAFAAAAIAQNTGTGPVTKSTSGANKNAITEDLIIPAARTLTVNGTFAGAPTGGTLDLHLLSLTLPGLLASNGISNGAKLDSLGSLTWSTDTALYFTSSSAVATYSLTSFARGVLGSVDAPTWRAATGSAPLASPNFSGTPTTPLPVTDTNTNQIASTAFVLGQGSAVADGNPAMDGTAARGSSTHFARADHVHPTDTTRFPVSGGDLTGTAGTGYYGALAQSVKPATPGSGFRFYADSTGKFSWIGTNGFVRTFDGTANTADRAYVLPDSNGTVQLAQTSAAAYGITNGAKVDALAALTWVADTAPYFTGTGTTSTYSLSLFARGVLGSADAPTWRTATGSAPLASPGFTGTPTTPTPAVDTNTTQVASTAFVLAQASASGDGTPAMDGTPARGASTHYARADHVHPTDTSRAPINSPNFTGTPTAPTAAAATSTTQLATTAFTEGEIARMVNPRAPRQAIAFDGTGIAHILGSYPNVGAGDFTAAFWLRPLTAINQGILGDTSTGVVCDLQSDGTIRFRSWNLSYQVLSASGAIAFGKTSFATYVRSGGIGTWYVNGLASGTPAADTYSFTGFASLAPIATNSFSGTLALVIYNRALSAADILALYESGAPAAADFNNASNTALNTTNWSTYISGYDTLDGMSATGFHAIAASGTHYVAMNGGSVPDAAGQRFRVKGTLTATSGAIPSVYVAPYGTPVSLTAGAFDVTISTSNPTATDYLVITTPGATEFTVSGLSVTRLGLLCAPEVTAPGNNLVWTDLSGNGAHIVLPTSGATWSVPSTGVNHIRGTTSTNGNQQLLGSTILPKNTGIIRIYARARSGTPSITIGTASGATDIATSTTLGASFKTITISGTGITDSSNYSVWIGSNSTDTVETDIVTSPLSF